jgi:cellulose synthase/poly-beta-1,6-N-acetylglucosamine synthase-like glycosyltransferase
MTGLPFASVVVPTVFARPDMLAGALKALCALDYPDYEVIVADNRVDPEDPGFDDPRIRYVASDRPGASAARNAGVRVARGEFIAFTDDDVDVDPGWLRALAFRFRDEPDADAVTGAVLPKELETQAQQWFEEYGAGSVREYRRASFTRAGWKVYDRVSGKKDWMYKLGPYGTGANMAFRASVLRTLGGFDEALGPGTPTRAGEDIELFLRLLTTGGRLAVEPAAIVHHTHRRTYPELREQMEGYGRGLTAMLTAAVLRHPSHLVGLALIAVPGAISALRRSKAPSGWSGPSASPRKAPSGWSDPSASPRKSPSGWSGPSASPRKAAHDGNPGNARRAGLLHGPGAYLGSRRKMRRWIR